MNSFVRLYVGVGYVRNVGGDLLKPRVRVSLEKWITYSGKTPMGYDGFLTTCYTYVPDVID